MAFKLAQLSDLHMGYSYGNKISQKGLNLREEDGYLAFSKIVTDLINQKVDAVVICGDVNHTPNPNIRTLVVVQKQLRRLADANIPVYSLAGNHDVSDIRSDIAASKVYDDHWRKIYSHAEPYVTHDIAEGITLHLVSHHMYSDQGLTMSNIKPVEGNINIFATHGSCYDPFFHKNLKTEASPREVIIPDGLIDGSDWSYTLLGHIHERGFVGSKDHGVSDSLNKKVFYNGSLIRRGFSDGVAPLGRGWTLWNIEPDATFTPTFRSVSQRPQYDFDVIDAANLNPAEINDLVINRLKDTQINGTTFDSKTSPILRQKIINISAAKKLSLDNSTINDNAKHALKWIFSTEAESRSEEKKVISTNTSNNLLERYDSWVDNSAIIGSISNQDLKKTVAKDTREFIKIGQEEQINEDN